MNNSSQETLRRVTQNDPSLTGLTLYDYIDCDDDGEFYSENSDDYSTLGAAIANNTHLVRLAVILSDDLPLTVADRGFYDGLKRNSSISDLELNCVSQFLVGGVGHEILKSYQKNNNNLTRLCIEHAVLDNGGGNAITDTLRWCRNIKIINLSGNSITDEQLLPMIEAVKGGCYTSLEHLFLYSNRIGNIGCEALVTLLEDPSTKLQYLSMFNNNINNEGATAIANSLPNNTKLKSLYLQGNSFDASVVGIFCTVLGNTSSVNNTYRSNHTLKKLVLSNEQRGQHANHLASLQTLNRGEDKSHVAIKKILKYHPNVDMEPFYDWDAEREQTLKALPQVMNWFGRAKVAAADDDDEEYGIEEWKLSAIFQFAKAMPLLFEGISLI